MPPSDVSLILHSLPPGAPVLPAGLDVRYFRPGDERTWLRIHNEVGTYGVVRPQLFRQQFGDRADALPARQTFVDDEAGRAIATVTAWFPQPHRPPDLGRLHWLAVVPAYQRQGIAAALVRLTCARLAELGYAGVYLTTGADNYPAIALYQSLGFRPEIRTGADSQAWEQIRRVLDAHPEP